MYISENGINAKFENGLDAIGVRPGDVLLVHSSLRSLGPVEGGAETVLRAFLSFLGEKGTLLMPALSYSSVTEDAPLFDVRNTPACVGALPEFFRKQEKTVRSIHPTHSVCAQGYLAREITQDHGKDTTPVGKNSPFRKLPGYGGKILMLGCGLRPDTSMHGVEELSVPPYLFLDHKVRYTIIDETGKRSEAEHFRHGFDAYGAEQRYDRAAGVLSGAELSRGKILRADCFLIDAKPLWEKAHAKLLEDPFYFVDLVSPGGGTRRK